MSQRRRIPRKTHVPDALRRAIEISKDAAKVVAIGVGLLSLAGWTVFSGLAALVLLLDTTPTLEETNALIAYVALFVAALAVWILLFLAGLLADLRDRVNHHHRSSDHLYWRPTGRPAPPRIERDPSRESEQESASVHHPR